MKVLDFKEEFDGMRLNEGSQVNAFLSTSDIVIYVGNRGVGKTHLMLYKALPHISKPHYRASYFRKMVKDSQSVGSIADKSRDIFGQFGRYLESVQNMLWKFDSGARIVFSNYSAGEKEFAEAIQGIEFYQAFIDEVTQISEDRFKAIQSNLRNTTGEKTQMFGTCNADPDSWIARLIARWLDPVTGMHIPELNGKEMFFFQWGNDITESHWGDTREEVYEQAKTHIDAAWTEDMTAYGSKLDLIMSISVYEGSMIENKHLMKSQGLEYYKKLLTMNTEMKGRYAKACWKRVDIGDSLISDADMDRFFDNSEQRTGVKYASLDVAGSGKNADKVVLWIWDGFHIVDVAIAEGKTPPELLDWTRRHLSRNGVKNENFIYDGVGVGWIFEGFFDKAVKFMSQASASEDSKVEFDRKKLNVYRNAKAEVVGKFLDRLKNNDGAGECGVSIDESVLNRLVFNKTIRQHLMEEKVSIRWRDDREGVKQVIDKKEVLKVLGHSPDFILSLIYRFAVDRAFVKMDAPKARKLANFLSF